VVDIALSFAALLPMLVVDLFADRLVTIAPVRRRLLQSFAGGIAAAYVFLLILPKLAYQQALLEQAASDWMLIEYFYHHAYFLALAGFVASYLMNVLADETNLSVPRNMRGVALVVGFGTYSALIGEMVAAQELRPIPLALFSMALTLHLVGLDLSIQGRLSRSWNWMRVVLATCLFVGWLLGLVSTIPPAIHALVSAFLAGAIIILVVLIELPQKRRPAAFVSGALTFAALLKLSLYLTDTSGGV
jgi:hypothetical protein